MQDGFVETLEQRLQSVAVPDRAAGEKRYLKSDLEFIGAALPPIRRGVRDLLAEGAPPDHDATTDLVERLWERPVHEIRMAAVIVLAERVEVLGPDDLALIERLVRDARTWALVDPLAADVVGRMIGRQPEQVRAAMDAWATDGDFWIRRASLLAELRPIRNGAALDPFLTRAEPMLTEREFFIRKAIGWVLREAGKRRPDDVAEWLATRTDRASGVTMREATKYLPPELATTLLAAYRARRTA